VAPARSCVIGGPDGASSHVAEQVVVKLGVPLLSPASTDPTLTQAGVPWIFRLPPDDAVQAQLLAAEIARRKLGRIALVAATEHDSRVTVAELRRALERQRLTPVCELMVDDSDFELDGTAQRLVDVAPESAVIALPAARARALVERLTGRGVAVPLLLPWRADQTVAQIARHYQGLVLAFAPFVVEHRATSRGARPAADLVLESPVASYTYDAATMIINALRAGATNRQALRERLLAQSPWSGVTGVIAWSSAGGNTAEPVLVVPVRSTER
jgi:branched-chain amino acid transport system substrate-binding protein